jgi:hypothetical protein
MSTSPWPYCSPAVNQPSGCCSWLQHAAARAGPSGAMKGVVPFKDVHGLGRKCITLIVLYSMLVAAVVVPAETGTAARQQSTVKHSQKYNSLGGPWGPMLSCAEHLLLLLQCMVAMT